jgi:metal-responsive CopG/Arc/MetJ family transcriptional regulator
MANVTSKTTMISARVPSDLVDRVDYVVRNQDAVDNRSGAVARALEQWTTAQEQELERLGVKTPKR